MLCVPLMRNSDYTDWKCLSKALFALSMKGQEVIAIEDKSKASKTVGLPVC